MKRISMHPCLFGIALLVLGLPETGACQAPPLAKRRLVTEAGRSYMLTSRLKSILVGDFFYNYDHHMNNSPGNMITTLRRLGAEEGWTVDVTTNGNAVTADTLRRYQVFFANYISSWATMKAFPAANRAAMQAFVEGQGGGLFLMHSSGEERASTVWPWFSDTAYPVDYLGASSRVSVSAPMFIPPKAKTHPVLEGVDFAGSDTVRLSQAEMYRFAHLITETYPDADILLSVDGARCTLHDSGTNCGIRRTVYDYTVPGGYPVSWTFPDKRGTIGFFMEGHDMETFKSMTQPVWDRFFKQFMYHMAGYDTIPVLYPPPSRLAHADLPLDASGITFHPSGGAGVFISKPGRHTVILSDLAGHKVREIRGDAYPADYDLSRDLEGLGSGVYVLRVSLPDQVRTKRFHRAGPD